MRHQTAEVGNMGLDNVGMTIGSHLSQHIGVAENYGSTSA